MVPNEGYLGPKVGIWSQDEGYLGPKISTWYMVPNEGYLGPKWRVDGGSRFVLGFIRLRVVYVSGFRDFAFGV